MRLFTLTCVACLLMTTVVGGVQAFQAFAIQACAQSALQEAQRVEAERCAISIAIQQENARIDEMRREEFPQVKAEMEQLEKDLRDSEELESDFRRALDEEQKWSESRDRIKAKHAELLKAKTELEVKVKVIMQQLDKSYRSADVEHRLRFERHRVNVFRMKERLKDLDRRIRMLEEAIAAGGSSPSGEKK
jgi:hypothetical protein